MEAGYPDGASDNVGSEGAGTIREDQSVLRDLFEGDTDRTVMQGQTVVLVFLSLRLEMLSWSFRRTTGT